VPRRHCAFLTLDIRNVPASRRDSFAALAVRRAMPFERPDWHGVVRGDQMMVWAWPSALFDAAAAGDGLLVSAGDRFLPEALLRGEVRNDAVELLACDEGVDARVWANGVLVASRWFPALPSAADWQEFLRGAGQDPGTPMPTLGTASWREKPWTTAGMALDMSATWAEAKRPALALAGGLAALAIAWPLGAGARQAIDAMLLERRIDALSEQLSDVLGQRDAAVLAADEITSLLALRSPRPALALMAALDAQLGSAGYLVREIDLQQGNRLRLVLAAPGADPQALVKQLMDSGILDDVRIDSGAASGEMVIQADVRRGADA
jgi:hypothetical protein